MAEGNMYPEKIARYFSSMNSLSGKVIADIQAVEDLVKLDPNTNTSSYNYTSKVIDKHLIHDVILHNKNKQAQAKKKRGSTAEPENSKNLSHLELQQPEDVPVNLIHYNDPDLDRNQDAALIMSVYPKKPEKYVYEDNSIYLDEHSEPFSYCTQKQASFCPLEKLARDLPLSIEESLSPSTLTHPITSKHSDFKPCHPTRSYREKKNPAPQVRINYLSMDSNEGENHHNINQEKIAKEIIKTGGGLGLRGSKKDSKGKKEVKRPVLLREDSTEEKPKKTNNEVEDDDEESNLPKQVQNLDLIAELQAKLKLNKGKHGLNSTSSSCAKVKPKAPPPPPPTNKPETSKDVQKELSNKQTSINPNPGTREEDFCVDVSSPCRIPTPRTGLEILDNW